MAEPTEHEKTTRKMANEYNDNHKQGFVDLWLVIEKIRARMDIIGDKLPNWAVYYISFLSLLVGGLLGALIAIIVTLI